MHLPSIDCRYSNQKSQRRRFPGRCKGLEIVLAGYLRVAHCDESGLILENSVIMGEFFLEEPQSSNNIAVSRTVNKFPNILVVHGLDFFVTCSKPLVSFRSIDGFLIGFWSREIHDN